LPDYENIADKPVRCGRCGAFFHVTIADGRVRGDDYQGKINVDEVVGIQIQSNVAESSACLKEAIISFNGGANRAATVMARAALEVALQWAGFTDRYLDNKIDHAVRSRAIRAADEEQAEHVRLIGNFGAHGTGASYVPSDRDVTPPIARAAVEFSADLIRRVIAWHSGGGTPV